MSNGTSSILNPSLFINSFEWREPVTTTTDFMVALAAMYALFRFISFKGEKSKQYKLYQMYFLCFAIGMSCAAFLGHGFQAYISPRWKAIGWTFGATGQLFFIIASINQMRVRWSGKLRSRLKTAVILKYFLFLLLIAVPRTSDFKVVQLSSSLDLIVIIMPLQWLFYKSTGLRGSLFIVLAIIYAIVPGIIYSQQWSISKWFNYHDISHLLMSIFMISMFYGTFALIRHKKFNDLMTTNPIKQ
jgi:hypothetical protein